MKPRSVLLALGLLSALFGPSGIPGSAELRAEAVSEPPARLGLKSPDQSIEVLVSSAGALSYEIAVDGQPVLRSSKLGLRLQGGLELGRDVEPAQVHREAMDTTWTNALGKRRLVRNHYNELRLLLREKSAGGRTWEMIFRAFDDGIAFRYVVRPASGSGDFILEQDETEFAFAGNFRCYAGENEKKGYAGPQEWEFKPSHLADFTPASVIGLPILVQTPVALVAIAEADLLDWSGMWLGRAPGESARSEGGVTLAAKLAPLLNGRGLVRARAPHASPWRVLMIARQPGQLIESDLISNLATPCLLADTTWIKPGMMAWDHWWSADVQMDTGTLEHYIQLAADMGWPYQLIDWQWYGSFNHPDSDITHINPAVDLVEVRRFAKEKRVRLWLWLYWTDVDRGDAYEKAFALYESWGIAGVKIDFMERDDQEMVNWYEKITRAAAAHHLMVNFHGAFKPTGLNRTLPNQITREAVMGNEYNRWSARVTPEHKLTLPFTRFLAGPADFTPGGFLNRQPERFEASLKAAEVQGTRAAELALFVVYDSPITCVCDAPEHYRHQPGADFLRLVPTVWDDTRVLDGAVAQHLVMARRSGGDWFLGALTDRGAREIPIRLGFLGSGRWRMRLWKDAADSGLEAEHLDVEEREVVSTDTLDLRMAPAGGAVARFQPE